MTSVIDGVKSFIWNSTPNGYGNLRTKGMHSFFYICHCVYIYITGGSR